MNKTIAGLLICLCAGCLSACSQDFRVASNHANVSLLPTSKAAASTFHLDRAHVPAMYSELMSINLAAVVKVAQADNLDIKIARQQVKESRGRLASSVGAAFPVLAPTAIFNYNSGVARSTAGNIVTADFRSISPAAAIQWVVNPGRVIYNIVAAKKRLNASRAQQAVVIQQTIENGAIEYYQLVQAQADVVAARDAEADAEELLRFAKLRLKAGTAIPADVASAEAEVASRRQGVLLALNRFYHYSTDLAITLNLDPTVTLVPSVNSLKANRLVRTSIAIGELLKLAVKYRPDLQRVRELVRAAQADGGAIAWGDLGPTLTTGYKVGDIDGRYYNVTGKGPAVSQNYGLHGYQNFQTGGGWQLGLSTFGDIQTAKAREQIAAIRANKQLALVEATVVKALQDSRTNAELIPIAADQVRSAQYALNIIKVNYRAGTVTSLEVLVAESQLAQAQRDYAAAIAHFNQSQIAIVGAVGLVSDKAILGSSTLSVMKESPTVTQPAPISRGHKVY
ncbi:MAG: TolC family protein [Phycisphaerae bacterium]